MKARRLILHLGHGKTGSTSIQRALRASPEVLGKAAVLFPDPGRHDNHQLLFPHLHGSLPRDAVQFASLGTSEVKIRDHAATLWADLRTRIEEERPDTIVLSCENQFRPFDEAAMARLCKRCNTLAEVTQVVAYLRSPASYFLSMVQQDVKKRPEFRFISPSRCRDTLEPFLTNGPGEVIVRLFHRDALEGGDVVTDFVTRMLPGVDPARLTRGAGEENTSVSAEAMAVLQEAFRETRPLPARYTNDKKAFRKIVVAEDARLAGATRPVLFDGVRACVEARVSDHDWLEERFGLIFPDMPTPAMPRKAAEEAFSKLRDIRDICAVDEARKEALWEAALRVARGRGLWGRIRRGLAR